MPILCLSALLAAAHHAPAMTAEEIDSVEFSAEGAGKGPDPLVAKMQILLDRHHASPGVIDGYPGENVDHALRAFETMRGLEADGILDEEVLGALAETGGRVTTSYTLVEDDFSGLVEDVPENFSEMAEMEGIGYTSVEEKLAERFHMDVKFLKALNPEADFSRTGTEITVADTGSDAERKVVRIEVEKQSAQLRPTMPMAAWLPPIPSP